MGAEEDEEEEFSPEFKALMKDMGSYRPAWLAETSLALTRFEEQYRSYTRSQTTLQEGF